MKIQEGYHYRLDDNRRIARKEKGVYWWKREDVKSRKEYLQYLLTRVK